MGKRFKNRKPSAQAKIALAVAASSLAMRAAHAASVYVTYSGGTYAPSFSTLPFGSTETTSYTTTTGTASLATEYNVSALNGWYGNSGNGKYASGTPSTTTGEIFSFGSSSSNQSIGAISTSSTGIETFGVELENNTGNSLNQVSISFTDTLWWQNSGSKYLKFGLALDNTPGNVTADAIPTTFSASLTSGNIVEQTALEHTFATGGTGATLQTYPQSTDTISLASDPLVAGGSIWLVWQTSSSSGTSQGVGVNNLSFSAANVSSTNTDTWTGSATSHWNASDANWNTTASGTKFTQNDAVIFADTASPSYSITVDTVAGSGVAASSVLFSANSTAYSFSGGSINDPTTGGSAIVTLSGSGTVTFGASNSYSGGTVISAGTLVASGGDNRLGASAGAITIAGGTLKTAASGITSARNLTVNPGAVAGTGTFNTNSLASSTSGTTTINDTFNVTGGGSLALDGAVTFGTGTYTGAVSIASGTTLTFGQSAGTINQPYGGTNHGTLAIGGPIQCNSKGFSPAPTAKSSCWPAAPTSRTSSPRSRRPT